ncbi:MAG: 30S ribosomal protein S16 [Myxococcota bacterium]
MVKVRLSRAGRKRRPFFNIVVADSESPRNGKVIERIGLYDPAKPEAEATVAHERLDYWLGVGAQMTQRVKHIVNRQKRAVRAALTNAQATNRADS